MTGFLDMHVECHLLRGNFATDTSRTDINLDFQTSTIDGAFVASVAQRSCGGSRLLRCFATRTCAQTLRQFVYIYTRIYMERYFFLRGLRASILLHEVLRKAHWFEEVTLLLSFLFIIIIITTFTQQQEEPKRKERKPIGGVCKLSSSSELPSIRFHPSCGRHMRQKRSRPCLNTRRR